MWIKSLLALRELPPGVRSGTLLWPLPGEARGHPKGKLLTPGKNVPTLGETWASFGHGAAETDRAGISPPERAEDESNQPANR